MEWIETTGRTLDEAVEAALDELGVHEEEFEYEVLVEPRAGFLGRFGGTEARIRARVKPISREKPNQRRRRNRRGERPERSERGGRATSPPDGKGDRETTGAPARVGIAAGDAPAAAVVPTTPTEGEAARGGSSGSAGGARRRRRRRRPAGAQATTTDEGTTMDQDAEVSIEEQAKAAEVFTRGLVDAFGASAHVGTVVTPDDDAVLVEVTGDNLGLLVGPRGATLHAIEELVRTVVQRQTGGHGVRINVDVAGYRAKRRDALEAFTRQLAARVLETGREQALEPMSAADRKVVHDVAATIDGVETTSEGEDPRRRVVLRRS
ncbi:MAG TPA: RNA-binding cell elongation regulator Jag/EloR [Acidimicrobiia bacterium]|nr:RNA-binding cell elongation regulator Jag/EloR [Acidimicrobiia bacterium]